MVPVIMFLFPLMSFIIQHVCLYLPSTSVSSVMFGLFAVCLCSEVHSYLHLVFPFCSSSFVSVFLVLSYVSYYGDC